VRTVRELPAVATALGVDADSVQAQVQRQVEARRAARAAADSTRGGGGSVRGGEAGRGPGGGGTRGGAQRGGAGTGARQAQVVFVKTPRGLEPRIVRLGISDFDYVQVTDGLEEGDEVALLSVAEAQTKRQNDQAQMRQRMGSGMPGVGSPPAGGRGTGGR
jgi:HlyD family secretion protein